MLRPWDLHSVDKKRKKNKVHTVFFFPTSLEDIISRWVAAAVNSFSASPLLLRLEANPLISCVSTDLQRTHFFIWKRERRRISTSFSFLFFFFWNAWFVQPLQNGYSVIVLCSWEMIWNLCKPEWDKKFFFCCLGFVGLRLVRNQRLPSRYIRSLFSVRVDYRHSSAPIVALSFLPGSGNMLFFVTVIDIHQP